MIDVAGSRKRLEVSLGAIAEQAKAVAGGLVHLAGGDLSSDLLVGADERGEVGGGLQPVDLVEVAGLHVGQPRSPHEHPPAIKGPDVLILPVQHMLFDVDGSPLCYLPPPDVALDERKESFFDLCLPVAQLRPLEKSYPVMNLRTPMAGGREHSRIDVAVVDRQAVFLEDRRDRVHPDAVERVAMRLWLESQAWHRDQHRLTVSAPVAAPAPAVWARRSRACGRGPLARAPHRWAARSTSWPGTS